MGELTDDVVQAVFCSGVRWDRSSARPGITCNMGRCCMLVMQVFLWRLDFNDRTVLEEANVEEIQA